jgi:peptidoglycan hydrolase-like protein with peptidoglycan-binding domain
MRTCLDDNAPMLRGTARGSNERCGDPGSSSSCGAAVLLAGCSSGSTTSSSSSSTTTTAAPASTIRALQAALANVGCYQGPVDGTAGPMTTQAVREFQQAEGLTGDGVYALSTRSKLLRAEADGMKVCTTAAATTTTVGTTTTTAATNLSAPCTVTGVAAALPAGDTVTTFKCAQGWAAGSLNNESYEAAYLLQSSGGKWVRVTGVSVCSNGSIPAAILDVSPARCPRKARGDRGNGPRGGQGNGPLRTQCPARSLVPTTCGSGGPGAVRGCDPASGRALTPGHLPLTCGRPVSGVPRPPS